MGFTGYPLTQDSDWLDIGLAQQLVYAFNERRNACNGPTLASLQAGDDATYCSRGVWPEDDLVWPPSLTPRMGKLNWRYLLYWLEAMCGMFIDSSAWGHNIANLVSSNDPLATYTFASWRAATRALSATDGINVNGFECMKSDETLEYRYPLPDDYMRIKLFNQCYYGLKCLRYTKATIGVIDDGNGNVGGNQNIFTVMPDGGSTAVAAINAALAIEPHIVDYEHSFEEPACLPTKYVTNEQLNPPPYEHWEANYSVAKFKGQVTSLPTARAKTVKFLFNIINKGNVSPWPGAGWQLGESVAGGTNSTVAMTSFVGSSAIPDATFFPTTAGENGYICNQAVALIDWGFNYI